MNTWLLLAAVAALGTCATHIVLGGRFIAAPLLASQDLGAVPKFTHYYTWHMVTVVILAMTLCFAYAAWTGETDFAWLATALAVIFTVWNAVLIAWKKLRPKHFPQGGLFAVVALLGLLGLS